MSGAKFQIGDTVRYTEGYEEPIGVIQARSFDPELMWWTYRVSFYKDDNPYHDACRGNPLARQAGRR